MDFILFLEKKCVSFSVKNSSVSVGGSLYLSGTSITSLPDNLSVGGSLYLRGTSITSLPDNLSVGGSLDLSGTSITSLPDNLSVGEGIFIEIEAEIYPCVASKNSIKIGCQEHSFEKWSNFSNKEILEMDGKKALNFWNKNKELILTTYSSISIFK